MRPTMHTNSLDRLEVQRTPMNAAKWTSADYFVRANLPSNVQCYYRPDNRGQLMNDSIVAKPVPKMKKWPSFAPFLDMNGDGVMKLMTMKTIGHKTMCR